MSRIFPAIMAIDPFSLNEKLKTLENLGFHCLHADVLDGVFGPYISYGPAYYEIIAKNCPVPLEIHFQVHDPIKHVKQLKTSLFERIVLHAECLNDFDVADILRITFPCKIGIAVNPSTALANISRFIGHERIDKFVLMAAEPGSNVFNENIFNRLIDLRKTLGSSILIQVDGCVRVENIAELSRHGADEFVCGSALFGNQGEIRTNYTALLEELRNNCEN